MHINKLVKQAAPKVVVIKRWAYRALPQVKPDVLSLLYKLLVRSSLEYASVVWDNCSAEDAHSLEKIQLSVARAALPLCRKQDLLKVLNWPTLPWRRRR